MMAGTDIISNATSLEDHTDSADNPTRDTLAEGLLCLIKPFLNRADHLPADGSAAPALPSAQIRLCQHTLEEYPEGLLCLIKPFLNRVDHLPADSSAAPA